MTEIKELDAVASVSSIPTEIIGEARTVLVQTQTKGTVVIDMKITDKLPLSRLNSF